MTGTKGESKGEGSKTLRIGRNVNRRKEGGKKKERQKKKEKERKRKRKRNLIILLLQKRFIHIRENQLNYFATPLRITHASHMQAIISIIITQRKKRRRRRRKRRR